MFHAPPTFDPVCPAPAGFRADLPRWRQLVAVDWLAALQAHQTVVAAPVAGWSLFEVACDGLDAFVGGHIPGAHYLDTRQFEQLPFWNVVPREALQAVLQHAGIRADATVVLYGRNTLAVARVAHCLLTAGVQDVRLLDGGLAAWSAAGQSLHHGHPPQSLSLAAETAAAPLKHCLSRPDYLIHTAQAKALLAQPDAALVSIRTRAEFLGETSGYSYIAARGEIPEALWGHAGSDGDVNSMGSFQNEDGRMKPAAEIAAMWRAAGIRPDMCIAFYCGTGWRASLAFFYAWLMGWERISVYDGGWFEWSSDPANPVICRTAVAFSGSRFPNDGAAPECSQG